MSQVFRILTMCDVSDCVGLSTQEYAAYVGHRIPEASQRLIMLPDGWSAFNDKTFCPRHKVDPVLYVDGKIIDV